MWGVSSLPQTKVIPLVDLVITAAGTNTTVESFYYGKRTLALPVFADQSDNAQRIHETGLGLRLDPFRVTEEELLSGIEKLLEDEQLERSMLSISKRMQTSNSVVRAADMIENLAKTTQDKK